MKRLLDFTLAVSIVVLLAVPMMFVALLVRLTSSGPALYWSDRVGLGNRVFRMPKFRSMRVETPDVATHLLSNPSTHLTPVGGFLRKTSLDELPQVLSILRGHMSFVGPRPALFNQHDLVALRTEYGVHRLVPGLTGLAQLASRRAGFDGSDTLDMRAKVVLDGEYLERQSIILDLIILWQTLGLIIRRRSPQ